MKPRTRVAQKWKGIRKTLVRLAIPALFATASFAAAPSQTRDGDISTTHYTGRVARDINRRDPKVWKP